MWYIHVHVNEVSFFSSKIEKIAVKIADRSINLDPYQFQCSIFQLNLLLIVNYSILCIRIIRIIQCTVKPVLSGHSKIDKTKILITNGS